MIEEDGTEVDDEEYFSTLADNTVFMLLFKEDIWSPEGPAYTYVSFNNCSGSGSTSVVASICGNN